MTADFDQGCVELDRALFLRMNRAAGTTITCLQGCLWITRDGSPKDVELSPGETYRVEDAARVIVTGFGPGLARVRSAATQRRPAARPRLVSVLRGWSHHLVPV
jgi:hypothetical protein